MKLNCLAISVTKDCTYHNMASDIQQQQQQPHKVEPGIDMMSAENNKDNKPTDENDVTYSSAVLQHRNWIKVTDADCVNGVMDSTGSSLIPRKLDTTTALHSSTARRFRLATYNILSDNAIGEGSYLYCPSQLRYMSSRHQRIIDEIRTMQPHIVCFQVSSHLHTMHPVHKWGTTLVMADLLGQGCTFSLLQILLFVLVRRKFTLRISCEFNNFKMSVDVTCKNLSDGQCL